ncbi:MAG TPA: hypothetical protein VMV92_09040 [Streptosporangiaceae bacterium]|nr:hypothetical protein [Streptosporangiaceae bacterium]
MVLWPLNVEDTPELIDLSLLIHGPGAGIHSHRHEGPRYGSSSPSLHPKIDSRHVAHTWLPLQGLKMFRLGPFSFAED